MSVILYYAPTYGQTNNLIEVDRDSLYTVFANYQLLKAWSDMAQENILTLESLNGFKDDKIVQMKGMIDNYEGVVVPNMQQIQENLNAIIEKERKIGRKKGRRGFMQGILFGAGIVGGIVIFN